MDSESASQRQTLNQIDQSILKQVQVSVRLENKLDTLLKNVLDIQQQAIINNLKACKLVKNLHEQQYDREQYRMVMQSLAFETMDLRYDEVHEAFQDTYEWIFRMEDSEPNSFVRWLRQGQDIYWINGKAGSGKSTLMKFLHRHGKYREHLDTWAAGDELVLLNFFFWRAGSHEQKSIAGLLRTVLFQILERLPSLGKEAVSLNERIC